MTGDHPPLLTLERVSRIHAASPPVVALDAFELQVGRGEFVALLGPSGSGKTTVCNIAAGWETPDEGSVRWHVPMGDPPAWHEVASVPQRLGLIAELSLADNVRLPGWTADRSAEVEPWLERLGLASLADHLPAEASLGEQQRTALARALAVAPHLAILDEPTSNQDEVHVVSIIEALADAQRDGTAVLAATHDQRLLARADRVVALRAGRIDPDGPGWLDASDGT